MKLGTMQRSVFETASATTERSVAPEITITTAAVDLMGDRVFPDGLDLSGYKANPAVLWAHDAQGFTESAGIPIGTATALDITPGQGIRARWRWLEGDAFAARVRNAWEQGIIRADSIGFIPLEAKPNKLGGYDISRSRLLEFSLVPIPANPEAVRALKSLGLMGAASTLSAIRAAVREAIQESGITRPSPSMLINTVVEKTAARIAAILRRGGR
jgi:phage head maturation protease